MLPTYRFDVHIGDNPEVITQEQLEKYVRLVGLDRIAKDRFSWLFALNLYLYDRVNGIDPTEIIDEIKKLEAGVTGPGTKPATEFRREPLRGLWHKHFFSAHFVPQNLLNHLANGRLEAIIEQTVKQGGVITEEMIANVIHQITEAQLEDRYTTGKITGEWIVFAKHEGANYYLCLSTHTSGDQVIYDQIKSLCFPQFPFLQPE